MDWIALNILMRRSALILRRAVETVYRVPNTCLPELISGPSCGRWSPCRGENDPQTMDVCRASRLLKSCFPAGLQYCWFLGRKLRPYSDISHNENGLNRAALVIESRAKAIDLSMNAASECHVFVPTRCRETFMSTGLLSVNYSEVPVLMYAHLPAIPRRQRGAQRPIYILLRLSH